MVTGSHGKFWSQGLQRGQGSSPTAQAASHLGSVALFRPGWEAPTSSTLQNVCVCVCVCVCVSVCVCVCVYPLLHWGRRQEGYEQTLGSNTPALMRERGREGVSGSLLPTACFLGIHSFSQSHFHLPSLCPLYSYLPTSTPGACVQLAHTHTYTHTCKYMHHPRLGIRLLSGV